MSTRIEDVTKILNQLIIPIGQLNTFLQQERVSYELIRGDLESLYAQKQKMIEEGTVLAASNASKAKLANDIVETAKEEAKRIAELINDRNAESIKILEEVKEYRNLVDKKKWQDLKTRAETKVAA